MRRIFEESILGIRHSSGSKSCPVYVKFIIQDRQKQDSVMWGNRLGSHGHGGMKGEETSEPV